jgi:hypothetical protein
MNIGVRYPSILSFNNIHITRGVRMEAFEYLVEKIDGDYAQLRRIDLPDGDLKLVARAILPPQIEEGTHLLYEYLEYSVIDE